MFLLCVLQTMVTQHVHACKTASSDGCGALPAIAASDKGVYVWVPTRCKKRAPLLHAKTSIGPKGDMADQRTEHCPPHPL